MSDNKVLTLKAKAQAYLCDLDINATLTLHKPALNEEQLKDKLTPIIENCVKSMMKQTFIEIDPTL